MSKARRKKRPSVPRWFLMDTDGCWWCHHRRNCNSCKILKCVTPKRRELQEAQRQQDES